MYLYKPYDERTPDHQYRDAIRNVLTHGVRSGTQQGVDTFSLPYPVVFSYRLENGFPWITSRKLTVSGKMAINELFAFINGVHNNDVLREKYGVPFWDSTFEDPGKCERRGLAPGDIGPASYGPVLRNFPTRHGRTFDQIQAIVEQIQELPHLKTHIATTLYPPGIFRGKEKQQEVVTVPCHGTVLLFLVLEGQLSLHMVQRSGDLLPGVPHNTIQYAALLLAMGFVTGYPAAVFNHTILNPHIYEHQREKAEEFLSPERDPRPFPTLTLQDPPSDIHLFRKEHFVLEDYHPHSAMPDIPVAP